MTRSTEIGKSYLIALSFILTITKQNQGNFNIDSAFQQNKVSLYKGTTLFYTPISKMK